jgi:serine/threonine-protein kinase
MAPEQAAGRSADIGAAADVYALGAILYEALTGEPPFKGQTKIETLRQVREDDPVPPSHRRAGVPAGLEAICLTCLEKTPARRYRSASALAEDLDRWLRGGRSRGLRVRLRRLLRLARRRWRVVAAGLVLAVASATALLHDSDRPLRRMQADLRRGSPVQPIGETGRPAWSRWRAGESGSQTSVSSDGTFTVHSWSLGLLELLPDPGLQSYRFDAQVRHRKSDRAGEVGIYVGHQSYPGQPAETHFFTQLTFNEVWRAEVPEGLGRPGDPPPRNAVRLFPHLYAEGGVTEHINWQMPGATGPNVETAGENHGGWHDLAISVTPAGLTATWDGQPFRLTSGDFSRIIDQQLGVLRPRYSGDPFVQVLSPQVHPRAGLGLYVRRGSASFRRVSLHPLPAVQ